MPNTDQHPSQPQNLQNPNQPQNLGHPNQVQHSKADDLCSIATMAAGLGFFIMGLTQLHRAEELGYVPIVLMFGGPSIIAGAGAGSHGGWSGLTGRLKNTLFFTRPTGNNNQNEAQQAFLRA